MDKIDWKGVEISRNQRQYMQKIARLIFFFPFAVSKVVYWFDAQSLNVNLRQQETIISQSVSIVSEVQALFVLFDDIQFSDVD